MKAAVWVAPNKLEMKELPEPEVRSGEVVIKVLGCGVCGTDCHIFAGEVPLARPPQVLGHEIYGEVVEPGPGVSSFKPGQRVCVDPVIGCGICSHCQEGKTNLCVQPTIIGYARPGGFAQYTSVPETHLYGLSEKVGPQGGILAETLACVVNGYDRLKLEPGKTVLILGAGCVGLLWNQLIKRSVSTRLVQTEVVPWRGEVAKSLGADWVIDANKADWPGEVWAIEPEGVDYIIDATGSAKAIQESLALLKSGSTLMVFGVCPAEEKLVISPYDIFVKELSLIGAKMPPFTLNRAVKIIEAGLIDCNAMVRTTMPLSQLAQAIDFFHHARNKHIKIMIDPWLD